MEIDGMNNRLLFKIVTLDLYSSSLLCVAFLAMVRHLGMSYGEPYSIGIFEVFYLPSSKMCVF